MGASAIVMGATGIALLFLPQEIANETNFIGTNALILQILGALYLGFAMLNWNAKANLIGGIYSKPVSIGNLTHFSIGALALAKSASHTAGLSWNWIVVIVYTIFAILFGYVSFTSPVLKNKAV